MGPWRGMASKQLDTNAKPEKRQKNLEKGTKKLLEKNSGGRLVLDTKMGLFPVNEVVHAVIAGRADIGYYSPERLDRMVKEAVSRTVVLFDAVNIFWVGKLGVPAVAGSAAAPTATIRPSGWIATAVA